jgi:nucleoside-diphosphate-sugar epimerase
MPVAVRREGVHDIIAIVNELLPAPKAIRSEGRLRQEEILDVVADISRVRREFSWEPRVAFRDGLCDTLTWIQTSRIL